MVDMSTLPVTLKLLVVLIAASAQTRDLHGLRDAGWTEVHAFDLVTGVSSIDREPVFASRACNPAAEPSLRCDGGNKK
jgi:hypothetical protein